MGFVEMEGDEVYGWLGFGMWPVGAHVVDEVGGNLISFFGEIRVSYPNYQGGKGLSG